MTPTEPTVENPQIAVPPSLVGSAAECRTRGYAELSCPPIRPFPYSVRLESSGRAGQSRQGLWGLKRALEI